MSGGVVGQPDTCDESITNSGLHGLRILDLQLAQINCSGFSSSPALCFSLVKCTFSTGAVSSNEKRFQGALKDVILDYVQ